eukprot:2325109-Amphidinium_carterae.1
MSHRASKNTVYKVLEGLPFDCTWHAGLLRPQAATQPCLLTLGGSVLHLQCVNYLYWNFNLGNIQQWSFWGSWSVLEGVGSII